MKRVAVGLLSLVVLAGSVASWPSPTIADNGDGPSSVMPLPSTITDPLDPNYREAANVPRTPLPVGVPAAPAVPENESRLVAASESTPMTVRSQWPFPDQPVQTVGGPAGASRPLRLAPSTIGTVGTPDFYVGPNLFKRVLGTVPSGRNFVSGALDVTRNVDVIFGGIDGSGATLADTWTFDGYKWTLKSPATSPPARSSAAMVWDAANSLVVLFGGVNGSGTLLNDTWVWNGTTWTQKFPATSPSARRDMAATFMGGTTNAVVMLGGRDSSGAVGATWKWSGTTWSQIFTTGTPTARSEAAMVYSPDLNQVILFGGKDNASTLLDDTWILSGTTWTQQTPSAHPSVRRDHSMIYSSQLSTVELFGGRDATDFSTQVWGWVSGNWALIASQIVAQTATAGAAMVAPATDTADPKSVSTAQLVFFAGMNSTGPTQAGTFFYDWSAYGNRGEFDLDSIGVTNQSALYINRGDLEVGVVSNDITLAGVTGSFTVTRRYEGSGGYMDQSLSDGWAFDTGQDLRLQDLPDGDKLLLNEQGATLWFNSTGTTTFATPHGIDATLVKVGSNFELTYNGSKRKLTFNSSLRLVSDADRDGNAVTFTYVSGVLSTITDTRGVTLSWSYNGAGQVNLITDSTGRTWQYGYNASGILSSFTNAEGEITSYDYSTPGQWDQLTKVTSPDGNQTVIGYPSFGQVTVKQVTNIGAGTGPTTTWTLVAPSGAGLVTYATSRTTITDPLTHQTEVQDDAYSRQIKAIDANGHARLSTWDPQSNPATLTNDAGSILNYTFNASNRVTKALAPPSAALQTGSTTNFFYGGPFTNQTSSATDPQGNCTAFNYNTAGNVQTVITGVTPSGSTGCDGGAGSGGTISTIHRHGDSGISCGGKAGQVCSVVTALGGTTSYAYNATGDLTTVTPPSPLGASTYSYDSLGRVTTVTDGATKVTRITYDNQGRITKLRYNNQTTCPGSHVNCSEFVYDNDGNLTSRITDQGTTTYTYDALQRLTGKDLPAAAYPDVCAGNTGMRFTYDTASNLTSYCDAGGTVNYRYDNANQLLSVQEPGANCTVIPVTGGCTQYEYVDAAGFHDGNVTKITYPPGTGVVTTYSYNLADNVTAVTTKKGATFLQNTSYTWIDGAKDRTLKQSQTVSGRSTYYKYDTANQLCWASPTLPLTPSCASVPSGAYAYTYDQNGNRTSERDTAGTVTNYAFNAADELCKRVVSGPATCTTPNYTYDGNGNRQTSNGGTTTWTYNPKSQADSYTPSGGSLTAISYHDTDSTEQAKIGNTDFAFTSLGLAADKTSSRTTYYVRTPKGALVAQRVSSAPRYYITDNIGSVVGLFNSTGTSVYTYTYDPIGKQLTATGTGDTSNYRFATGYLLPGTTLYKMGTRYYDPDNSGTWTQRDPSGRDRNPYAYTSGNPVSFADPSGKDACDVVGFLGLPSGGGWGTAFGILVLLFGIFLPLAEAGYLLTGLAAIGQGFCAASLAYGDTSVGLSGANPTGMLDYGGPDCAALAPYGETAPGC